MLLSSYSSGTQKDGVLEAVRASYHHAALIPRPSAAAPSLSERKHKDAH